ncbi:recombinase family protein [Parafrankia elaeagni]|uniref:recombinase family protein n=1 Tax=Parafrankia elaeagni TaxID=222534 RepID=UPI0003798813|nr:recombinase family protein [Parafrankia elaeagni]
MAPTAPDARKSGSWEDILDDEERALLAELLNRDPTTYPTVAVIYGRISSDPDQDAKGVARQVVKALLRIQTERTWRLGFAPFIDNDISATKGKQGKRRPHYERMMSVVREDAADVIVTYMMNRLWRNRIERASEMQVCTDHRIRIIATNGQDLDLSSSSGRVVAGLLGELDTYEVEVNSERSRDEAAQRAKLGLSPGGRCYGYDKGRKVNPAEAAVIKDLADKVLKEDWGIRTCARYLNTEGIKPAFAAKWSPGVVRQILTNAAIAGLRYHNEELIGKAAWEPIISTDTHVRLVARLCGNGQPPGWSPHHRYLLSGIATCGKCGAAVQAGRPGKTARSGRSYQCPTPSDGGCRGVSRVMVPVDALVENTAVTLLSTPGIIEQFIEADLPDAADVLSVAQRIEAAQARAAALGRAMAHDDPDNEVIRIMRRAQQEEITTELATLRRRQAALAHSTVFDGLLDVEDIAAHWQTLSLQRRRAIIRALVSVTIMPTGPGRRRFEPDAIVIKRREAL